MTNGESPHKVRIDARFSLLEPKMTNGDKNVVYNVRHKHGEKVAAYSDEYIAETWCAFSQSDEYPSDEMFLEWLELGQ